MNIVFLAILGGYIVLGALVLIIFELATKRVRSGLNRAVNETQLKLGTVGLATEGSVAKTMFLLAMVLLWPAVLIGAATDKGAKKTDDNKKEEMSNSEQRSG